MSNLDPIVVSKLDKAIGDRANAAANRNKRTFTKATVTNVQNGEAFVQVEGSDIIDTPTVGITSDVQVGDSVNVIIDSGRAYILGNYTTPATDDTKAIDAQKSADTAQQTADEVQEQLVVTNNLVASKASIADLNAAKANIDDLNAKKASVDDLKATNAEITELKSSKVDTSVLEANYAKIDLANVNNAWLENGVIKDAAIDDAQILGVSANKITTGELDAGKVKVINLDADNIKTGKLTVGGITIDVTNNRTEIDGSDVKDGTITVNGLSKDVVDKIDGAIQTWTVSDIPTLLNAPAIDWSDDKARDEHVGDVAYVVNSESKENGYCYRFAKDSDGTYSWILIKDSDVTAALQRLTEAEGDISGLKTFETETNSWKTDTTDELSNLKARTTNIETDIGNKVDSTTFNELKQTVDENSSTITTLSDEVSTKADNTEVETLSNTVNEYKQTADQTVERISSVEETVDGLSSKVRANLTLRIDSSRGTVFKNSMASTILSIRIYQNGDEITTLAGLRDAMGDQTARIRWWVLREDDPTWIALDDSDPKLGKDNFELTIKPDDINIKCTFKAEVVTD